MPFKPGQSGNVKGKPVGAKSEKTKQWEELANSIVNEQSEQFNEFLMSLWTGNKQDKALASELYLKTLEYFKPRQARTEVKQEGVQQMEIIIKRKDSSQ
jgi:hypothetical protein